jgi:hypothetical protein
MFRWLLFVIVVAGTMCACKEHFESYYPSASSAAKTGAFDHGWLPEMLKPDVMNIDVMNITEWHDFASNESRGRFALDERVLNTLRSSCQPATDMPRKTWSTPEWFPASITRGEAAAHGMLIFRCDNFFVAADKAAATGFFWEDEAVYGR